MANLNLISVDGKIIKKLAYGKYLVKIDGTPLEIVSSLRGRLDKGKTDKKKSERGGGGLTVDTHDRVRLSVPEGFFKSRDDEQRKTYMGRIDHRYPVARPLTSSAA